MNLTHSTIPGNWRIAVQMGSAKGTQLDRQLNIILLQYINLIFTMINKKMYILFDLLIYIIAW